MNIPFLEEFFFTVPTFTKKIIYKYKYVLNVFILLVILIFFLNII